MEAKDCTNNTDNSMAMYFVIQVLLLLLAASGLLLEDYTTFGLGVIGQLIMIGYVVAKYSGSKGPQQN